MLNSKECKELAHYLRNKMQSAYFQSDFEKLKGWASKLDEQANSKEINNLISSVREWQFYFGRKIGNVDHTVSSKPIIVSRETAQVRVDFIHEELQEYLDANLKGNIVGVLDAILDILYFVIGMVVIHGLQDVAGQGFDIVHKCNMSKLWPGNIVKTREDGKVLKPNTFKKPEPELEKLFE